MNTKALIITILAETITIAGCVSIDSTREQLVSSNVQDRQEAERNILSIASKGESATGFQSFDTQQRVAFVNLISNNELLLRIIDESHNWDVVAAAADRIDLSSPGIGMEIVKNHKKFLRVAIAHDRHDGHFPFVDNLVSSFSEKECRQVLGVEANDYFVDYPMKKKVAKKLITITEDIDLLSSFYEGNNRHLLEGAERDMVVLRLASLADRIDDPAVIANILNATRYNNNDKIIGSHDARVKLISRLGEDAAVKYALSRLKDHSIYCWNDGDVMAFEDAVIVAMSVKDSGSLVRISSAILAKIALYKKECKDSWTMFWGREDIDRAKAIVNKLPKFPDAVLERLICENQTNWSYFVDSVSADVAYNVLVGGKAQSAECEMALFRRLPTNRVDLRVYNGVRYDNVRKAVNAAMPAELKKQAAEAEEAAYAGIIEKAKAAAKDTFELKGFYLGMSFDDMKIVFARHFPDLEITEAIDGEGEDADYVINVSGQVSPFCYASVNDKKVYQFNFGKRLLKKWYKYDVQTYMGWAMAYADDTGINMVHKRIKKDTTVYEMDFSRSYRVWFSQESYQFKHNTKEYRLTYFGEADDFTLEGGIGGSIIRKMAAPHFRYVRGDPGSLRAKIERD